MMRARGRETGRSRSRAGLAWLVGFALIVAPVIVALSHGPAAALAAEEIAWHGHSHAAADDSAVPGHDATDHEHHFEVLAGRSDGPGFARTDTTQPAAPALRAGAIRDGPRRPPRFA